MRFQIPVTVFLLALSSFAKDTPAPILRTHSDVKLLDASQSHTEDLQVFADGRVHYAEIDAAKKRTAFQTRLSAKQLEQLTALLNGKPMLAVPAKIGSQIKVLEGQVDKKLEIQHASSQQTIVIENFYPQLNAHRPAYPRVLVQLECTLQDIQRKAAKRPAPDEDHDWCPDALGKR